MGIDYEAIRSKINNLENDKYAMLLVKAIESSLVFTTLAEQHIESLKPKNITMKNYAREALFTIIEKLDSYSNFGYFSDELEMYLGFAEEDDVASDIFFKCCCEGKTDIDVLKQELLNHVDFWQFPEKFGRKIRLGNEDFYVKF